MGTGEFGADMQVESVNDGDSGGTTAAPIAADIFTYLKNNPPE